MNDKLYALPKILKKVLNKALFKTLIKVLIHFAIFFSFFSCTTQMFISPDKTDIELTQWQYFASSEKLPLLAIKNKKFANVKHKNQLAQLVPNQEGWIYLRTQFQLNQELQRERLSLFLGRVIWTDTVYLNGKIIGSTGSGPPQATNFWNISRIYPMPPSYLKQDQNELHIVIYVKAEGALSDVPAIGPTQRMQKKMRLHSFLHVEINVIFTFFLIFISLYHFLLFWYRRKDKTNLHYALFLFAFAIYNTNMFIWAIPWMPYIPYLWLQKIVVALELLAIFWGIKFFHEYYNMTPGPRVSIAYRILIIIPLLVTFAPWNYQLFFQARSIVMLFILYFLLLFFYWSLRAVIKGIPHSKPMFTGVLVLIGSAMHDVLLVIFSFNGGIYIASWGFTFFLFSIFFTLAKKFVQVHNEVEQLNISLEDKVIKRTEELNNTLHEVQKLKEQQDGDYFLTTLLITPLSNKALHSPNTHVDFIVEQKKHFKFRKYEEEIGGDLCTAHTIYLRGKPFTVFLNADAMGKSMQGAGGILVLGSVFQNIIERVHTVAGEKELYPEKWLKNTVKELHKIFESFNGSMLISIIMGLIDDYSGLVYYINAEHPFFILYRDSKSQFIETEMKYRKLGTTGMHGSLHVDTFQLQPGDMLFSGSDGKDDLRMLDESGQEYINEDETQILRFIEQAQGDLDHLYQGIKNAGELMDDLSLLRIQYLPQKKNTFDQDNKNEQVMEKLYTARKYLRENEINKGLSLLQQAYTIRPENEEVVKTLIKYNILQKNFPNAIEYLEPYIHTHPQDVSYLYLASYCYKKSKNFTRAIDLGERIRIRTPDNVKNLVNLGHSYLLQKNKERAGYIIDKALEIDPKNNVALRLKKRLT